MTTRNVIIAGAIALAIVGGSLLTQAQTSNALARCENRGGSLAECRLAVLGR